MNKGKEKGRIHTEVRADAKRKKRTKGFRFKCIRVITKGLCRSNYRATLS
jgi:hypothetical protein